MFKMMEVQADLSKNFAKFSNIYAIQCFNNTKKPRTWQHIIVTSRYCHRNEYCDARSLMQKSFYLTYIIRMESTI